MKKRIFIISAILTVCAFLAIPFRQPGYCDEKIISQFINSLSKSTGLKKDTLQGKYFNNISDAKAYIQQHQNSYIMGSLGFFLANRKGMNLVPLAVVNLHGNDEERYYLVAEKSKYKSLSELKGKVLSGNILYEDKKFINRMIFNDTLDVSHYFKLKPTSRPLSAIRKLIRGDFDAVLLNSMQYNNLKKLSDFNKIQIIHESPKMPALGLMMINTAKDNSIKSRIVNAVTTMCSHNDTKEACMNFGIQGFATIKAEL